MIFFGTLYFFCESASQQSAQAGIPEGSVPLYQPQVCCPFAPPRSSNKFREVPRSHFDLIAYETTSWQFASLARSANHKFWACRASRGTLSGANACACGQDSSATAFDSVHLRLPAATSVAGRLGQFCQQFFVCAYAFVFVFVFVCV